MELLSNIYVLSLIGGLIMVILCHIDSKMNNTEKPITESLKLFIISSLVILSILFFKDNLSSQVGGAASNKITETIFTGNPNF